MEFLLHLSNLTSCALWNSKSVVSAVAEVWGELHRKRNSQLWKIDINALRKETLDPCENREQGGGGGGNRILEKERVGYWGTENPRDVNKPYKVQCTIDRQLGMKSTGKERWNRPQHTGNTNESKSLGHLPGIVKRLDGPYQVQCTIERQLFVTSLSEGRWNRPDWAGSPRDNRIERELNQTQTEVMH